MINVYLMSSIPSAKGDFPKLWTGPKDDPPFTVSNTARLFRLTLEKGDAGARNHAFGEGAIPYKEIAEAISTSSAVPTVSKTSEGANAHFVCFIAHVISTDNVTSSR